jgi:hypothetical protein
MYNEVIQAVIDMAQAAAGAKVVLGSLPPDNGLAMTGNASSYPIFLDIGSNEQMNIVCNGKNTQQQAVISQLEAIHASLTRRKDFPSTDTWQLYAIETTASPRLIGREQNSQWLYGSSLLIKFNVKGIN